MSQANVVEFSVAKYEQSQKFLLDLIDRLDIEHSLEHLCVTIIDESIDPQAYVDYLFNFIQKELELIKDTIKGNEPKLWHPVAKNIKEQMTNIHRPTRFVLHFKYTDDFDSVVEDVMYELLLSYRADLERWVITGFNINYDSLPHIATLDYLYPEMSPTEPEPLPVIRPS